MLKLVTFIFCIVNSYRNLPMLAYGNLFGKTIVLYPVIKNYSTVALAIGLVYTNGVALAYGHK